MSPLQLAYSHNAARLDHAYRKRSQIAPHHGAPSSGRIACKVVLGIADCI